MYELILYETSSGNRPVEKYIKSLIKQHKDDDVLEIKAYFKKLSEYGFEINKNFKPEAIKHLGNQIYELRPSSTRVFFFHYTGEKFVLLHAYEKKQNKTNDEEIDRAEKEMKEYKRRFK